MNERKPGNLDLLAGVAERIAPLLDDVVLVGGCAVDLLVTDPGAPPPRVTLDVDLAIEVASYLAYADLGKRLANLGFGPGREWQDPICRFRSADGLVIDLMPADPAILGFGSRWFGLAVAGAWSFDLAGGRQIRCIAAPLFLAAKLDAFASRGRGDVLASHDLEDVLAVINGRPEVASEVRASDAEARSFIVKSIDGLMASDAFRNAAPGLVDARDPSRLPIVWERLETIAALE
jgi:hypothetical protein